MQKANDLQDSVSKILHIDNKLEQDEMEGVEDKEWVRIFDYKNIIDLKKTTVGIWITDIWTTETSE